MMIWLMIKLVNSVSSMLRLVNEDTVDTTWAFIKMVEYWNTTEQWRPFEARGVKGEVSTLGNIRNCPLKIEKRRVYYRARQDGTIPFEFRNYLGDSSKFIYHLVLDTFYPNPNPLYYKHRDHINRIPDDDRLANLRWVPAILNCLNSGLRDIESYTTKRGIRYRPRISYKSRKIGLGTCDTYEEAAKIYDEAQERAFEVLR
jgi:hypothetical protein